MSARPRIVVTNPVFQETASRLAEIGDIVVNGRLEPWSREDMLARAKDADAIMAFMTDCIDDAFLAACPKLRIVAGALKGYDNIDRNACTQRGIWLTVVPDLLTAPTAEIAVALTLGLNRNVLHGDDRIRRGDFRGWRADLYGFGLDGANVGIAGLGRVGIETASRLSGFGCALFAYDIGAIDPERLEGRRIVRVGWERLLQLSDVLILALPLTGRTQHLVDAPALAAMRPGARIVNVGRGSVVDEAAVAHALADGRIAGYAADVFEFEDWARPDRPLAVHPRLVGMPDRTLFTPHLGSAVTAVRREIEMAAVDNIVAVLAGEQPPGAVNDPFAQAVLTVAG